MNDKLDRSGFLELPVLVLDIPESEIKRFESMNVDLPDDVAEIAMNKAFRLRDIKSFEEDPENSECSYLLEYNGESHKVALTYEALRSTINNFEDIIILKKQ